MNAWWKRKIILVFSKVNEQLRERIKHKDEHHNYSLQILVSVI